MLLRLLGEATDPSSAAPCGSGTRTRTRASTSTSVVSVGYGAEGEVARQARRPRPDPDGLPRHDGRGPRGRPLRRPDRWREIGDRAATDYYAVLGVARDAIAGGDQEGLPPARARAAPGREPGPGDAGALQGGHRGLRGALRPARSARCTTSAATRSRTGGGFGAGLRLHRHHGRVLRRGGGAARAAAAAAPRPGRADPASTSTWPRRRSAPPASSRSTPRSSARPAPARAPRPARRRATCDICRGRGEVQQVTRSFLGQVMTTRPCAACQGFGTVIPRPVPGVRRRRPGPHPPHADGQDPAGRRHRHPHPARRRGRGRPRRRPGRRPVRRDRRAPAPALPAPGRRPALHGRRCR